MGPAHSGNLSGHLLTLRPGLLALADRPIFGLAAFEGLVDTAGLLADAVALADTTPVDPAGARVRRDIESAYDARPSTLAAANQMLQRLIDLKILLEIGAQAHHRRFRYDAYVRLLDEGAGA